MTARYEVIEYRVWVRDDGATASIFGARPWVNEQERSRWEVKTKGWTLRNMRDGSTGCGRPPSATHAEAQALADKLNAR